MIITWCTDPAKGNFAGNPNKFSSFYQYETVTKQFVRVRLELNRSPSESGGDKGETFVNYKESRTVGFSTDTYPTSDLSSWSVDGNDQLCFDRQPLNPMPTEGAKTYDCSDVTQFVHRGNPVTANPNFPAGIEAKHLSLLANNAIIKKTSINLTANSASPADLSDAIKTKVSEVVRKSFDQITHEDILNTLKHQVTIINNDVIKTEETLMKDSTTDVDSLISEINEKIESGVFTPNQDVETAFQTLKDRIQKTKISFVPGNRKEVISAYEDLQRAQNILSESINTLETEQADLIREAVQRASSSVNDAYDASVSWGQMQTEFETAENAETIDEFEESMKGVET